MRFIILTGIIVFLLPAAAFAQTVPVEYAPAAPAAEKEKREGGLFSGHLGAEDALQLAQEGAIDGLAPADGRAQAVPLKQALKAYQEADFVTAYRGFFPLARKGNAGAQEIIGVMFLNGQGVDIDEEQAGRWLTKAAEQNRPLAQHYLGVMHENGTGVDQDSVLALMWLELAISNYPDGPDKDRALSDRDNVALQISNNQQSRARAMMAEWKKQHPPTREKE